MSPLLERLAGRVRARRKQLSLTLREVSERAGVSERFLVLLEGGAANVSVTRLDAIAQSLGITAAELLLEEGGNTEPREGPAASRRKLVALLGMRGAGKSAIGTAAAERLGIAFTELDARVMEQAGMPLAQIFEQQGVHYYRRLEREAFERLLAAGHAGIVATGGSIVTDLPTYELLRRSAVTIWLKAKPQDHWSRVVAQGDARPTAHHPGAMQELRALLRARRALYERAHHEVDTSALGLARAIDRVVQLARDAGIGVS